LKFTFDLLTVGMLQMMIAVGLGLRLAGAAPVEVGFDPPHPCFDRQPKEAELQLLRSINNPVDAEQPRGRTYSRLRSLRIDYYVT